MTPPFFGLDIAARALRANQMLVDVANQNVANANTPGYSRQTADLRASLAYPIPTFHMGGFPGQLGSGVEVSQIQHYEGPNRVDGRGGRWNSFVFFNDPDGNQWAIQERPAE